jgi:hypothetical protein
VGLAGSALEAAGIYLRANPACDAADLGRYGDSALTLVAMLVQLRQVRLALVVVAGAKAIIEQSARAGADADGARAVSRRLMREGMRLTGGSIDALPPLRQRPVTRPLAVTLH